MPRKTTAHRTFSSFSAPSSVGTLFRSAKSQELYETLNFKRKIWAVCKVFLDGLDPAIRANFECRGWLPLLDIDYPPPATLIREFTITPCVVADALGVPVVSNPVYPYDKSPPLNDIKSYITGTSIWWGFDPRIPSSDLTETTYLFFRIACHSLWPISHLHTIPLE